MLIDRHNVEKDKTKKSIRKIRDNLTDKSQGSNLSMKKSKRKKTEIIKKSLKLKKEALNR